ncbi:MAG: EamA family transporter RarD [Actinomycetia bacterium]|nr:EamA family transporter RarD [Actinomycetes bacterium]
MEQARGTRGGVALGLGAYLLWGLFPLYFRAVEDASPTEILAHRIVWSLVFLAGLVSLGRRWGWLPTLLRDRRRMAMLTVAAAVIALNWGVYIWAVNSDQVVEAALGYFVNPLVTVLLGVVLLGERLRPLQWTAVGLGTGAVLVLTAGYGRLPWIALVLAGSFATYGLVKKTIATPAVESLTVETAILFLPALGYLALLQTRGDLALASGDAGLTLLLLAAGPITAVPLLLFGASALRIPLSTIGLLQYVTPVMQFLIGVAVFGEPMPAARWAGFALVWTALALLTADGLRQRATPVRPGAEQPSTVRP